MTISRSLSLIVFFLLSSVPSSHATTGRCTSDAIKATAASIREMFPLSSETTRQITENWPQGPRPYEVIGEIATYPSDRKILFEFPSMTSHYVHRLYGTVQVDELVPGYRVLRITTDDGMTHLVDPDAFAPGSARIAPDDAGVIPRLSTHRSLGGSGPIVAISDKNLRNHLRPVLCEAFWNGSQQATFQRLNGLVNRSFRTLNRSRARDKLSECMAAFFVGSFAVGYTHGLYRQYAREHNARDIISEHGSNFAQGLGYMYFAQRCLNAMNFADRNAVLAMTLGLNVAGNVWEEIDIPGLASQRSAPLHNSAGQEVHTDWGDFSSGMLSTVTYLVAAKIAEQRSGGAFNIRRFCAR